MIAIQEAYRSGLLGFKNWLPNLVAGLIVGVVALPLAMAFAIASGVPPTTRDHLSALVPLAKYDLLTAAARLRYVPLVVRRIVVDRRSLEVRIEPSSPVRTRIMTGGPQHVSSVQVDVHVITPAHAEACMRSSP